MNRSLVAGYANQVRGRLIQSWGRLVGDPLLIGRGAALVVGGTVQVTCGKATRQWSHAMRGLAKRA
jgi:uncharacterized protein YjbJ (UPF0337 family)